LIYLKKLAKKYKPFTVISMDGDADRPILTDEKGEFLDGDLLGLLVSLYLKPKFVSIPISSNDASVLELKRLGIEISLTKIGSPYCIDAMNKDKKKNKNAKIVSWERNGGYLLGSDFIIKNKKIKALPTRDAILPILIAILFAKEENKKLSKLIKEKLPKRFMSSGALDNKNKGGKEYTADMGKKIIKNFSFLDSKIKEIEYRNEQIIIDKKIIKNIKIINEGLKIKKKIESFLNYKIKNQEIVKINYIDGIRIELKINDIIHLRPSSNSPEFRIYITSNTKEKSKKLLKLCLQDILPKIIKDIK